MKLSRRSFWGLFAGLFTIPFLPKVLPTFNKSEWLPRLDQWTYHLLSYEHQDMLLRAWNNGQLKVTQTNSGWNAEVCPYDPYTAAACKERRMFGSNRLQIRLRRGTLVARRYFGG